MKKCKHEWRQLVEAWDGTTPTEVVAFYCINCLNIKEKKYERNV